MRRELRTYYVSAEYRLTGFVQFSNELLSPHTVSD